jgi:hypothetical protein
MKDVAFSYSLKQSAWVALRIYPSAHSNPVFVQVDGKPIHTLRSAQWCRAVVDQCWKMKKPSIRESELAEAEAAYNSARGIYDKIIEASR